MRDGARSGSRDGSEELFGGTALGIAQPRVRRNEAGTLRLNYIIARFSHTRYDMVQDICQENHQLEERLILC